MPEYGSVTGAKQLLRAAEVSTFTADQEARLTALQKTVTLLIEHETGRVFGSGATPETVVVNAPGVSPILVLPKGLRTVTTLTVQPAWNGTTWTGGTVVASSFYRFTYVERTGEALALARMDGWYWYGTIVITGTWENTDADTTVPDDITYLANYLMAERFKVEQVGPAGQMGPDGQVVPIRNVMKDPFVRSIIDTYTVSAFGVAV